MANKIYKYELNIDAGEPQNIDIPGYCRPLSVINQRGKLILYAEVQEVPIRLNRNVIFRVVGTGWEYPVEPNQFVGTADIDGFVWHVFQLY